MFPPTQSSESNSGVKSSRTQPGLSTFSIHLQEFLHFLRAHNYICSTAELIDANKIVLFGHALQREHFQSGLKTCICKSKQEWLDFDKLFLHWWKPEKLNEILNRQEVSNKLSDQLTRLNPPEDVSTEKLIGFAGTSSAQIDTPSGGAGDYTAISLADFRFVFNPLEKILIEKMVDELAKRSRRQWSRRKTRHQHGSLPDLRKTAQRSLRYGGLAAELHYLKRRQRPARFVLLLDVSQSMEVYAKLFLRYTRQLMAVFQHSRSFAFNTELIDLGQSVDRLSEADLEAKLNARERQWLGGTKIAESMSTFNQQFAAMVLDKRTTVLIFSDGCDTAPAEKLAIQIELIQRKARRLIWVNPLLGRFTDGEADPNMDPVVPYVDSYHSAHNLTTLAELTLDLQRKI